MHLGSSHDARTLGDLHVRRDNVVPRVTLLPFSQCVSALTSLSHRAIVDYKESLTFQTFFPRANCLFMV